MRKRRAGESEEDKNGRLQRNRERNIKQRLRESSEDREERLSIMRNYMQKKVLSKETSEQREHRLSLIHERLSNETTDKRNHRLSRIRERLSNETAEERDFRLSRMRERQSNVTADERNHHLSLIRERLSNETAEERDHRLSLIRERLSNESSEQREHRLSLIRERLSNETAEERDHRLSLIRERLSNESSEQREHRLSLIRERLSNESSEQREHRLSLIRERLSNETAEERDHRLSLIRERLSNESSEQREHRLSLARRRSAQVLLDETTEERTIRLNNLRARDNRRLTNAEQFKSAINVFADMPCKICNKMLYPQQRTKLLTTDLNNLLPADLVALGNINTCNRCSNNIKKRKVPAQAFWNHMTVSDIPDEIANLTEIEKSLLLRIVPFLKIIRVQNRFSQDWCKGQVVLFAKDVIELAEQLPLQPQQAGLVIVTESLENLQRSREFQVDVAKLNQALQWLLVNNALYRDVRPSFSNIVDLAAITQLTEAPVNIQPEPILEPRQSYINIDDNVAILQGSFHQGHERFSPDSRGKQCTAIAAVACTAFNLMDPNTWCKTDIDYIVILGDKYYRECVAARVSPDDSEVNREYLAVTELLPRLIFDRRSANVSFNYEATFNGHLENDNSSEGFPNLKNALLQFFEGNVNTDGLLTSNAVTVAVHCRNESGVVSYWLFDSHARGAKGCKAPSRGTACCMRFNSTEHLYCILRRNLFIPNKKSSTNNITLNVYSLTPIMISPEIVLLESQPSVQPVTEDSTENIQDHRLLSHDPTLSHSDNPETRYVYTTSMLHTIDEGVPDLNNIVSINEHDNVMDNNAVRLAEITR
ncbi:unnamed protein product [Plutella xylostella]|uniref:(diamondback moth) hypothetical protein n=1 Tax=Plutella xylostella TaxID=51655 RepID=A0A8S4G2Y0_PLUXY|nr:unnamed protein product [Plutella xylostella]